MKDNGVEIKVVGADNEEYLLEAVPDQPGKVYKEKIMIEEESYHILRQQEKVPMDVEPIRMVEVEPGQYKKLSEVEVEEMQMRMARVNLEEEPQEEFRPFEEVFEEYREPFP